MKNLTTTLCLTLTLLLGSVSMSWSADLQKGLTAYESGDYATALREWTPLAEQGDADAQTLLGVMYNEGKGVPQDYKTAVKWYTLAAKQGDANAKTNLSNLQKILERTNFFDTQTVTAKKSPPPKSAAEKELAELRREVARLKKENKSKPKQVAKQKPEPKVVVTKSSKPYVLQFKKVAERPDDIAVIIANSNYTKQGKDIPNVDPAYNDGENIKKYFMDAKGIREGNIIYLKDATGAQLTEVFGNERNYKANLFNWVKPNKSKVYVYYVGHGAPASNDGSAFLVPVDAKSQTIEFSGYPLDNLYRNLGKIKARSVTVILEACFSGVSQAGMLLPRSSGITIVAKASKVPANVKVISAGSADQMASWEKDESQSLFTKYFLRAMSGEGDKNKDGKVDDTELQNYLDGTMTYFARRYYGRDQKVQIALGR